METLVIGTLGISILGMICFGIFVVTKRQEATIELQKEAIELLKK